MDWGAQIDHINTSIVDFSSEAQNNRDSRNHGLPGPCVNAVFGPILDRSMWPMIFLFGDAPLTCVQPRGCRYVLGWLGWNGTPGPDQFPKVLPSLYA